MNWRKWPLAVRLTLAFTLIIVIVLAGVTRLSIVREQQAFQAELRQQADAMLNLMTATLANPLLNLDWGLLIGVMEHLGDVEVLTFGKVYDAKGHLLIDAQLGPTFSTTIDPFGQQLAASDETYSEWQADQLVVGRAIRTGTRTLGAVSIGLSTASLDAKMAAVRDQGFAIGAVAGIVGAVLALLLSRSVTRPLWALARAAEGISAGEPGPRVDVRASGEVATLATAFNQMTGRLQNTIERLEQRADQLKAGADVARAVISILDPDRLLDDVVNLITERFGFYYAAIFTLDDSGRDAVLRAATGEGGRILKERGHRLEVGGESMVGNAIARRQARIALDVGTEAHRFANPVLPDTRSEIALPLMVGEHVFGALDVQSTQEAAFDEASITVLQTMADQIAVALDNARLFAQTQAALTSLQESRERYTLVVEGSNDGIWDWNLATGQMYFSPRWKSMIGYDDHELRDAFPEFEKRLHREDRDRVITALNDYLAGRRPEYEEEFRFRHRDGSYRWILARGVAQREADGKPLRMAGSHMDITARKQAEAETQEAFREVERLLRLTTREGWRAFRDMGEMPVGYLFDGAVLRPADDVWEPEIEAAVRRGETAAPRSEDKPVTVTPLSVRGEVVGALGVYDDPQHPLSAEDVRLIEAVSQQLAQALDGARLFEEARTRVAELAALNDITQALSAQQDLTGVIRDITERIRDLLNVPGAYVALYDRATDLVQIPYLAQGDKTVLLDPFPLGEGLASVIIRSRQTLRIDRDAEQRAAELGAKVIGPPAKSYLGTPIIVGGEVIGVLAAQDTQRESAFDEAAERLLAALAPSVGIAIENARLFGQLQEALRETRRRALREQLANQISARIRSAVTVDDVLRVAVDELRQATQTTRVVARLNPDHVSTRRQGNGHTPDTV